MIDVTPSAADFLHRDVPALGRRVHRVGLAATFGLDEAGIEAAFERGLEYVFWNPTARTLTRVLRRLPASKRDRLVLATGPTLGFLAGSVRRRVEQVLRLLRTDRIDVAQLFWLGRMSAYRDSIVAEMEKLRDEGKVRLIGASIHDRVRAGALAESGPLSLFMIRYNAAHPGAERDIFPHLATRRPMVVAYTATSWRRLLTRPDGWQGPLPTPADCYRFCLTSEHIDVVLMGPRTVAELDENLEGLRKGPLSEQEMHELRAFGRVVHG